MLRELFLNNLGTNCWELNVEMGLLFDTHLSFHFDLLEFEHLIHTQQICFSGKIWKSSFPFVSPLSNECFLEIKAFHRGEKIVGHKDEQTYLVFKLNPPLTFHHFNPRTNLCQSYLQLKLHFNS